MDDSKVKLLAVFNQIDDNNDGKLDPVEIIQYMTENGYPAVFARAYVEAMDKDGDNCISFEEFSANLDTNPIPEETMKVANMRVLFNYLDKNKKGFIEEKDIQTYLDTSNAPEDKQKRIVDEILSQFDKNHDKKISFEEFTSQIARD